MTFAESQSKPPFRPGDDVFVVPLGIHGKVQTITHGGEQICALIETDDPPRDATPAGGLWLLCRGLGAFAASPPISAEPAPISTLAAAATPEGDAT